MKKMVKLAEFSLGLFIVVWFISSPVFFMMWMSNGNRTYFTILSEIHSMCLWLSLALMIVGVLVKYIRSHKNERSEDS